MQKDSLDLLNVNYEDVLQLYRGWRKTEGVLRDKNKELIALKSRILQLQESHSKFRSQIQALESVKELTVSLQNNLSILQQENNILLKENKELAELNFHAEQILKDKEQHEIQLSKQLQTTQIELATYHGKYEESLKFQRDLEKSTTEEQADRMSAYSQLENSKEVIKNFKEENDQLRQKLDSATLRMIQCDQELNHASEQLSNLSHELSNISATRNQLATKEAENGILKGDISRLLHLVEYCPTSKAFFSQWQESGGMNFVGIDRRSNQVSHDAEVNGSMWNTRTFDVSQNFDGTPTAVVEDNGTDPNLITPTEFAHLKRIHGGDPFPVTGNYEEEGEYWVPRDAAQLGVQFMASKLPHAPPSLMMEFLRSMNKIWLRRERRSIKRVKTVYKSEINDLKRQLSHAKPYKGVLAERQIRRLKSQVIEGRVRHLTGRPRKSLEASHEHSMMFTDQDRDESDYLQTLPPHLRRPCMIQRRSSFNGQSDANWVATEKLLEASLHSLEAIGQSSQRVGRSTDQLGLSGYQTDGSVDLSPSSRNQSKPDLYPSESYLRGALWLGRNILMVCEELAEAMEEFRMKHLSELLNAQQDPDLRRSLHRLYLIANVGINESLGFVNRGRMQVREMIQKAAELQPGHANQFKAFMQTLPIESTLASMDVEGNHSALTNQPNDGISSTPSHKTASSAKKGKSASKTSNASYSSPKRSQRYFSILNSPLFQSFLTNHNS